MLSCLGPNSGLPCDCDIVCAMEAMVRCVLWERRNPVTKVEPLKGKPPFKGISLSIDCRSGRMKHATAACGKRNRKVKGRGLGVWSRAAKDLSEGWMSNQESEGEAKPAGGEESRWVTLTRSVTKKHSTLGMLGIVAKHGPAIPQSSPRLTIAPRLGPLAPCAYPCLPKKAASRPVATTPFQDVPWRRPSGDIGFEKHHISTLWHRWGIPANGPAPATTRGALRIEKPPPRSGSAAFASPDYLRNDRRRALWMSGPQ